MSSVTLDEAKAQCRVVQDTEDALIQIYMDAADDAIAKYLNRQIPGLAGPNSNVPAAIKAAALLMINDLYENRGTMIDGRVNDNPALERLLFPYRVEIGI